jgi:hypothetical protein
MKIIKRVGSIIKDQVFLPKQKQAYILELIKTNGGNAYVRKGNFSSEIVWDGKSYMFPSDNKHRSYKKGMFLFGMVRKDAKNFIKSGKVLEIPEQFPVNEYNDSFDKFICKITGTDLNHAYWRIAFNLGIISKATYFKGLDDEFKTVRLAALSTLGKGKDYSIIKDGLHTTDTIKIGLEDNLNALYKAIRYTCYGYMQTLKVLLKEDFVCYRTDCIFYVDTKENRKLVRGYFKSQKVEMKQLYRIKKTLHEQDFSLET